MQEATEDDNYSCLDSASAHISLPSDFHPYLYDEHDDGVTRVINGWIPALQDASLRRCSRCARGRSPRCDQRRSDQVSHCSCSHIRESITPQRRLVGVVAIIQVKASNAEERGKGERTEEEKVIL